VDGDRRLRAAEQLKIAKIDVWVKNLSDTQVMEDGIIFNKFRRNIGPVEIGRTLSILWKRPEHEMKSLTKFAHDMGHSKGDASTKRRSNSALPLPQPPGCRLALDGAA
jgi:hypothetical protein